MLANHSIGNCKPSVAAFFRSLTVHVLALSCTVGVGVRWQTGGATFSSGTTEILGEKRSSKSSLLTDLTRDYLVPYLPYLKVRSGNCDAINEAELQLKLVSSKMGQERREGAKVILYLGLQVLVPSKLH